MSKPCTVTSAETRFGRLILTKDSFPRPAGRHENGRPKNRSAAEVRCDCGTVLIVSMSNLIQGITKSCGCLHTEVVKATMTTHGMSVGYEKKKILRVHAGMKQRCLNPNADNYRWYGGRGIGITPEWLDSATFMKWAQATGYVEGLQLDRIDESRDYEPDNCRWVTQKKNIRNRDRFWDDGLDAQLVAYSARVGKSPYQVIQEAVVALLSENSGVIT